MKDQAWGVTSLGEVKLVGSFGEVHAAGIKLWGMKLWNFRSEKRVNLDYQALGEQVGGIKFWGSGVTDQAGRGIRLGKDQACGDPALEDQDGRG